MNWRYARFHELALDDLYDALQLRSCVFALEQQCIYLDADGVDRQSAHLLGRGGDGALAAYLRVVDPGVKYAEPSIGRVVTAAAVRGSGAGRALMVEGIARCRAAWPGHAIRINAQHRLERFYDSLGFNTHGTPYDEDGIPHIEMLLPPQED